LNKIHSFFLYILKYALQGEKITTAPSFTITEWEQLIQLSQQHHVLPLVFETVHSIPEFQQLPCYAFLRNQIRAQVMVQVQKTLDFQSLYQFLSSKNLHPVVVKGLICRNLYPYPDHRISSDEDLLILPDQIDLYHEYLTQYGLSAPASFSKEGGILWRNLIN